MSDAPTPPIQGSGGIATSSINFSPSALVTAPDVTNWHVISDDELNNLSKPEGGILGNFGFAALGAALGAAPSGWTALDKVSTGQAVSAEAFRSLMIMIPCIAATVICMILYFIDRSRGKGLVAKIKSRPTRSGAHTEKN